MKKILWLLPLIFGLFFLSGIEAQSPSVRWQIRYLTHPQMTVDSLDVNDITADTLTIAEYLTVDSVDASFLSLDTLVVSDSANIDTLVVTYFTDGTGILESGSWTGLENGTFSDSLFADTLETTTLYGGSTMRGSGTFTTTGEHDTVLVSGATASDYFFATPTGTSIGANDILSVEAKVDTLIVHRPAAGTSALPYNWWLLR